MKRPLNSILRMAGIVMLTGILVVFSAKNVKADEAADALAAQQALLLQAQQQQAALLAQQQATLLAQQQQQQAALLAQQQQQQQALLLQAQQQQAALLAQQYQAALQIQNNFVNQHADAAQQAFLLQQLQNQQYQQYQAMINRCNLDYKADLLKTYQKYQDAALMSFLGYNGY